MKRLTTPLLALVAGAALLLGSHPAQAHGTATSGMWGGLTHPLLGLDHGLMLVAVGAAAAVLSSRLLLWAAAGALAGAVAGVWGLPMPAPELWAAVAVSAVGGLVWAALAGRATVGALAGPLVAAGVAIHALLHGLEAPADGSTLFWWSGALLSSVLVCGGALKVFQALPSAVARAAAGAAVACGAVLALAPLALLVSGAGG
ncbi:MAG: HupE/UreJ family protein [Cyanobacteriota bacterium]|nr:HupE/UreJ family protein [Cyanobacteriota bacterium]